jgi:cellulose biosynthesis protein BcsQ
MHCEFSESLRAEFSHCLNNTIPYSSDVEKMGIERQPVIAFAPKSKAALSYKQLWAEIYDKLLSDIKATV